MTVATLENAKKWKEEQDQFVFCVVLLDISAWDDNCDELVNDIEDKFEELLLGEELDIMYEIDFGE